MQGLPNPYRNPLLVAVYVALLILWVVLTYDTYGAWIRRQTAVTQALAAAAVRPTVQPAAELQATSIAIVPTPSAAPMPPIVIPTAKPVAVTHPKTGRTIAAWLPTTFDADAARASFEANKDVLDEVSPFWYTADAATGQLVPETGARDRTLVEAAHAADVLVIPSIHNVYDPTAILPMLNDATRRAQHIAAIMQEVRDYQFDGIDIDYEMLPASSSAAYSDFMRELSAALHAENKLLTVAVHAKTPAENGLGTYQDWALLGEICDRVRIMTYDLHWMGGSAGPIAPMSWVADVAEYARVAIPPRKIQLGIPFYAYNWAEGEIARPETWNDVQQIIRDRQPEVNLREQDAQGQVDEAYFTYRENGKMRMVWFTTYRSVTAKLDFVEAEDLGGIAIWRLGNEDPRNWTAIREHFADNAALSRSVDALLPEH
jgi:spore germination protein